MSNIMRFLLMLTIFACFPLLANKGINNTNNEYYKTLIKQDIQQNDINLIVIDKTIEVFDVIFNDAGDVGYVQYLFTADVLLSFPVGFQATMKYTMTYEGAVLPILTSNNYYIGVPASQTQPEQIWSIGSNQIKIPLMDESLYTYTQNSVTNKGKTAGLKKE